MKELDRTYVEIQNVEMLAFLGGVGCFGIINPIGVVADRLCGLVVRVPGCKSRGPGSIPGAAKFSA
jgi:hypothetical protein